jgi:hypothetical protein
MLLLIFIININCILFSFELRTFGIAFVGSQYKKDKKCRFKTSKMLPIFTGFYSLLFKKGSSYTKTISQGLVELYGNKFNLNFILYHFVFVANG